MLQDSDSSISLGYTLLSDVTFLICKPESSRSYSDRKSNITKMTPRILKFEDEVVGASRETEVTQGSQTTEPVTLQAGTPKAEKSHALIEEREISAEKKVRGKASNVKISSAHTVTWELIKDRTASEWFKKHSDVPNDTEADLHLLMIKNSTNYSAFKFLTDEPILIELLQDWKFPSPRELESAFYLGGSAVFYVESEKRISMI